MYTKKNVEWKVEGIENREKMLKRIETAVEFGWIDTFETFVDDEKDFTVFRFRTDRKSYYTLEGYTRDIPKERMKGFARTVKK